VCCEVRWNLPLCAEISFLIHDANPVAAQVILKTQLAFSNMQLAFSNMQAAFLQTQAAF